MKRDVTLVAALWLVLTAIGELLAVFVDIYPTPMSDKAEEIEHAFRVLVYFAVPVFTLVIAVLVYTALTRRATGVPQEDGPPLLGRGSVPLAWFGITTVLALVVMIYPGLVGIPAILGNESHPDELVLEVEGVQWTWFVSYPQHGVERVNELVLPVDRDVRFEITSLDVLHSFWVPGFLMKIDAVPGRTTIMTLKPTRTGSFETDPSLRVQCAELCGMAHARMRIPVQVVSDGEFEDWVRGQDRATTGPTSEPQSEDAQEVTIIGENILFDRDEIVVEGGRQVAITFENRDAGIPHNWALYESEEASVSRDGLLAGSPIENGPLTQEIVFEAPAPGSYYFICDVHPNMAGDFVVE